MWCQSMAMRMSAIAKAVMPPMNMRFPLRRCWTPCGLYDPLCEEGDHPGGEPGNQAPDRPGHDDEFAVRDEICGPDLCRNHAFCRFVICGDLEPIFHEGSAITGVAPENEVEVERVGIGAFPPRCQRVQREQ